MSDVNQPRHASRLEIDVLPEPLAICRLDVDAALPAWATARPFFSVSRTHSELSIICPASQIPAGVPASLGWRALGLRGPFDFALVGITLSVAQPLAAAGVSIMPIATHDTDYVLVHGDQLARAVEALRAAGHLVHLPGDRTD
jgi:hypothetical protein